MLLISFGAATAFAADEVSFSHDVLPVLSDRCFHCHGPDESHREAELRLDLESAAKEDRGDYAAVVPGQLEQSELWQRIATDDPDLVMPPVDSHRTPLSEAEREAIRRWILDGAKWGKHWSLEPPVRPELSESAGHPIDTLVQRKLAAEGLTLSPRAAAHTQLRRLSFALTGMSPRVEETRAFVEEPTDEAWAAAIERMLASPHHAERMAMWWLDAARYSDSDGFQQDATRENWPWRDWVITAFQKNMPFDQFTIEQFAGDLLPDATDEQILATCFHRNHMTNGEGGRDPEESRIDYVIDRVNTTGTVWLGLTLGCCQCHSHKFDPVTQHDYYSLSALFNSIDEDGRAGKGAKPYLNYQSPHVENQIEALEKFVSKCAAEEKTGIAAAEQRFNAWLSEQLSQSDSDYSTWRSPRPTSVVSAEGTKFDVSADSVIQTSGPDLKQDDYRIEIPVPQNMSQVSGWSVEIFPHESHQNGMFTRHGTGDFILTSVKVLAKRAGSPTEEDLEIAGAVADYEASKKRESNWDLRYSHIKETLNDDARDGWTTEGAETVEPHVGVYELKSPFEVRPGDRLVFVLQQRSTLGHANIGRFRISLASERGETVRRADGASPIQELRSADVSSIDEISPDLLKRLRAQYLLGDAEYQQVRQRLEQAQRQLKSLRGQAKPRAVMVLKEREQPRETHVLVRGVWDAKGDVVQAGAIPSVLEWPEGALNNRLDFARWLVNRDNPLTSRVVVNHLWQIMFGVGLVRTPDDFGLQGELPTHPELLDWLAVELIEHDWDLRHILRLIATSETFRQSSVASAELRERDPDNRLLALAPRYRLPAWMLRDNALQVSGTLNPTVGGPPVYPYQPPGVWSEITMGRFKYEPSLGPDQYRRTVYSFWRRSSAPTFLFDSAQRRVCEVRLNRTNTPLQALTLMNDETMLESSRALADLAASSEGFEEGVNLLGERVLGREWSAEERAQLRDVYDSAYKHFSQDPNAAPTFIEVGQQSEVSLEQSPTTAAWMTVASLVLNLDEAISSE
ncbi:PSD1 and planctomycete cytochrome C domain-containing protein [Rubinisphaera margarita]|uniref:PSD1 and planctomycete cytochrome C domain-containing protein n=1 Tax=Rubinisphaera margarita TaxID=2909586 RepID=UPI001EE9AA08|nr:PSD1 and planctomycete cytochrome C domain-containing protein [Rubinisphaera margarita]MCG6158141.1 PSD1 and planctomycete cytochrome C domain-containing protein [Rubinisphaera margarita]